MESLIQPDTKIKVSSTLDKSVGKRCLVDGSPETCWTSQQGIPQYVQLNFSSPVKPRRIAITFQGGFVGTRCAVDVRGTSSHDGESIEWQTLTRIYPEDVNRKQIFDLDIEDETLFEKGLETFKLVFEESSDFFGRITVYDLKLEGTFH